MFFQNNYENNNPGLTTVSVEEAYYDNNRDIYKARVNNKVSYLIKKCGCDELNNFESLNEKNYYNFIYDISTDLLALNYMFYKLNTNLFKVDIKHYLTNKISGENYSYDSSDFKDYYLSLWDEKAPEDYINTLTGVGLTNFMIYPKDLTYNNKIYKFAVSIGFTENNNCEFYDFRNNFEGIIKFKYTNYRL